MEREEQYLFMKFQFITRDAITFPIIMKDAITFPVLIKTAVEFPMTAVGLPVIHNIDVAGVNLIISANTLDQLQIDIQHTIGEMDNLTLGFYDPFRLKEIST